MRQSLSTNSACLSSIAFILIRGAVLRHTYQSTRGDRQGRTRLTDEPINRIVHRTANRGLEIGINPTPLFCETSPLAFPCDNFGPRKREETNSMVNVRWFDIPQRIMLCPPLRPIPWICIIPTVNPTKPMPSQRTVGPKAQREKKRTCTLTNGTPIRGESACSLLGFQRR